MSATCSVPGCGRPHKGLGFCNRHYLRFTRTGAVECTREYPGKGAALGFLLDAIGSDTDECIIWPYAVRGPRQNYGCVVWKGRTRGVHRIVCEEANGASPSDHHEAAHSCGNSLCVNPRHLRWATPLENSADKFRHGTVLRGEQLPQAKLSEDAIRSIRALRKSSTLQAIASEFGVSAALVSQICTGKAWGWVE